MFDKFTKQVVQNQLNDEQLFQKFFVDSPTYFFSQTGISEDIEYQLKKDIAYVLCIHINDIYIVGSGQLGFSMKPEYIGRKFDGGFEKTKRRKDRSDIDIAIVSNVLFDYVQENIYDFSNGFSKGWNQNYFYPDGEQQFGVSLKFKFLEYLGRGWYRPDFAPQDYRVSTGKGILNNVLGKWKRKFDRKIAFALYKNWHFFKKYQIENIKLTRDIIGTGETL